MKRVLVVDDEQTACDMLKNFLTKKGYETMTALSGEEAIKKVKEERPHMILLDIRMPGIDGVETLKRIREMDKEVGVIMITACGDIKDAMESVKLGAYDYITKPFDLEFVKDLIEHCLEDGGKKK